MGHLCVILLSYSSACELSVLCYFHITLRLRKIPENKHIDMFQLKLTAKTIPQMQKQSYELLLPLLLPPRRK